uniref:Protein kinase domain-containing protein n=1 Tax=Brassica oleracea var. oleracea TaxID=109376 RepID=A0A0D3BWE6_BRAOL
MDPGDLAISVEAWEAYKKRDEFKSSDHEIHKYPVHDLNEAGPSGHADSELTWSEASESGSFRNLSDKVVLDGGSREENKRGLQTKTNKVMSRGYLVPSPSDVVAVVGGGGGIEGVRPLGLKLPPAKQPPLEHHGSSWDFLTHFAPVGEIVRRPSSSSSSEGGEVEREARLLESADTADKACPFTTNKGGDSSSTVSNTSPVCANGGSIITSWQKGDLLGRGSYARVYEGISEKFHYSEQGIQAQEYIKQLEREISLLSQLQHRNIVRYLGAAKDGSNLYIFLELVTQGSLLKLYRIYKLPDSVVSTYTRQILNGLKYLHREGIVHRDIKCANILVDANGSVKLTDFGLAEVSKFNDIKSTEGTPFWMAPEVLFQEIIKLFLSNILIMLLTGSVLTGMEVQLIYGVLGAQYWKC